MFDSTFRPLSKHGLNTIYSTYSNNYLFKYYILILGRGVSPCLFAYSREQAYAILEPSRKSSSRRKVKIFVVFKKRYHCNCNIIKNLWQSKWCLQRMVKAQMPYLTRILLAIFIASTEKWFSDCLLVSWLLEHVLAAVIINHGHWHLVQNIRNTTPCR